MSRAARCLVSFAIVCIVCCLAPGSVCQAAPTGGFHKARYVLPRSVPAKAFTFAGEKIPLHRDDVVNRVAQQVNFLLMDRRADMLAWFDRLALSGGPIRSVLKDEDVPADLLYLCILLSDMTPTAMTPSGGLGWWAIGSKDGARAPGIEWLRTNEWDDRRDPVLATRIACATLTWLREQKLVQNWLLAVCAYVDGTKSVGAAVTKANGFSYWDAVMPPYSEVLVPRLIALKIIDAHRDFYCVDSDPPAPPAYDYLDRLPLVKDLPLRVVAQWCEVSPRALWRLNPGVAPAAGVLPAADRRNPAGYPLRVPKGMAGKVRRLLSEQGYMKTN